MMPVLLFIGLVSGGAVFMAFAFTCWYRDGRSNGMEYLPRHSAPNTPGTAALNHRKERVAQSRDAA